MTDQERSNWAHFLIVIGGILTMLFLFGAGASVIGAAG